MNIMTFIDSFINNSMKYIDLRSSIDKLILRGKEAQISKEEKLELSKLEENLRQVSRDYNSIAELYTNDESSKKDALLMIIHKLDERIMKSQAEIIKSYNDINKTSSEKRAEKRIEDRKIMYYRAFIKDLNSRISNVQTRKLK